MANKFQQKIAASLDALKKDASFGFAKGPKSTDFSSTFEALHKPLLHQLYDGKQWAGKKSLLISIRGYLESYIRVTIKERPSFFEFLRQEPIFVGAASELESRLSQEGVIGSNAKPSFDRLKNIQRKPVLTFNHSCDVLNVDASINQQVGSPWSFGGAAWILRQPNGDLKRVGMCPMYAKGSTWGEFAAAYEGIRCVRFQGGNKVKLISDCDGLVKVLNGEGNLPTDPEEFEDYCKLFRELIQLDSYEVSHVHRELNKAANILATVAVKGCRSSLLVPDEALRRGVENLLEEDQQGHTIYRMVKE